MIAKHPGQCIPHDYQDQKYGPGFRVMNPARKDGKLLGARCTVCCPEKVHSTTRGGVYAISDLIIKR